MRVSFIRPLHDGDGRVSGIAASEVTSGEGIEAGLARAPLEDEGRPSATSHLEALGPTRDGVAPISRKAAESGPLGASLVCEIGPVSARPRRGLGRSVSTTVADGFFILRKDGQDPPRGRSALSRGRVVTASATLSVWPALVGTANGPRVDAEIDALVGATGGYDWAFRLKGGRGSVT